MQLLPDMDGRESDRLRFRKLTPADIDPWMEFHASEEAIRFFAYPLNDRPSCETMLGKQLWRYAHDNSGLRAVLLKNTNELIGMCGLLTQVVNGVQEWEIGYRFIPRFWGSGYCTEAAVAHRHLAFAQSNKASIISLIHPQNTASQAVARRNAMSKGERAEWNGHEVDVWRVRREDVL